MRNDHQGFHYPDSSEEDQIRKMAERGHEIAEIYQEAMDEVDVEKVKIAYSHVGNFTICAVVRVDHTPPFTDSMEIKGMVQGASKRHPDDDENKEIGRKIALARAVKGNFFVGPNRHLASAEDVFNN